MDLFFGKKVDEKNVEKCRKDSYNFYSCLRRAYGEGGKQLYK